MLTDRTLSANDAGLSGSAASQDRRIESIAEVFRIVGPIALGLAGVSIRLEAFLRNYPLSMDEAALARNIIERPWTRLFGSLDYAQTAPPGFLVVEKVLVSALGSSEYVLRLFPVLCGLLSLWLFWAVCRRLLPLAPALMAFGLFALNTSIVDTATRVKPYATDLAAAVLLLFLATKVFEPAVPRRRAITIALTGGLTCFFSLPSVFVLGGLAIACVYRAWREEGARDALLAAATIWAVSAVCGGLLARMSISPSDASYMRWFWNRGFMPLPPRNMDDLLWLGHQLKANFRWTALYRASVLWIGSAALGIWSFRQRQHSDEAVLLVMPLVLVVAASAAQLYPFWSGRLQLFLFPMLWILVAEGADWCRRTFSKRHVWIGVAPMIVLVALGLQATWSGWRIQRGGDLRSVLQYVKSHWRPDDRIFVHSVAGQVFLYYAPRLGFAPSDYIVGGCSDDVERTAVWQIETLRGRPRVWVAVWATDERELLFRYLKAMGTVRDRFSVERDPNKSFMMAGAAILYDLEATASPSVTPGTFEIVQPGDPSDFLWACYGVFNPVPKYGQTN